MDQVHRRPGEVLVLVTLLLVQIAQRQPHRLATHLVSDGGLDGGGAVLVGAQAVDVDDVEALGVELDLGVQETPGEAEGGFANLGQAEKIRRWDVSVDEDGFSSNAAPRRVPPTTRARAPSRRV